MSLDRLDIEAKARLVEDAFWEACPTSRRTSPASPRGGPHRQRPIPPPTRRPWSVWRLTLKDLDERKVGRAVSNGEVVEPGIATIPGFFGVGAAPGGPGRPACTGRRSCRPIWCRSTSWCSAATGPWSSRWHRHRVEHGGDGVRARADRRTARRRHRGRAPRSRLSAPARATRAATPTSACSPAATRGGPARRFLTVDRLRVLLPETADLAVDRYRLPALRSLNFVIHGLLQEGAAALHPPGRAGQEPRRVAAGPGGRHPHRPAAGRLTMDFDFSPEDDPRRLVVRACRAPHPTGRQLAAAGYVAPQRPPPWGLGADPVHRLIIDDELDRAGVRRPGGIGIGWAAPTPGRRHAGTAAALPAGDPERRGPVVPALQRAGRGSDLAGLTTWAERDGDEYVVTGAKIWSSGAHHSRYGSCRPHRLDAPVATDPAPGSALPPGRARSAAKAPGLLLRLPDGPAGHHAAADRRHDHGALVQPGVLRRRVPAPLRAGDEGAGGGLAKVTLSNERVMLSSSGSRGDTSAAVLLDLVRAHGGVSDRGLRQRLAMLHCESEVLRLNRLRTLSVLAGRTPGPEASIQKIMADEHGQHVMELAKDPAGPPMLEGSGPAGDVPERARTGPTEVNVKPDHHSPASTRSGTTASCSLPR